MSVLPISEQPAEPVDDCCGELLLPPLEFPTALDPALRNPKPIRRKEAA